MKLNFYPFHKHSYKVIKWRLVHLQNSFAPSSRVLRLKCTNCGTATEWLFDAPAPILWTVDGEEVNK